MYSGTRNDTSLTTGGQNYGRPAILHFGYRYRPGIIREVMGACKANGTMLRWSDQLLLAAENHHFEDCTHLKVKEGST